jgi:hypothetical protein
MGNQLATLSRKGWLTGIAERADRVYAYYLTTNKSQSYLYNGNVASLQATIQEVGNNATALQTQVQNDLYTLYSAVFDAATVAVSVSAPAWDGSNRLNITIDVSVTENGQTYSLGTLQQSFDSITKQLVAQTNG